MNDKVKEVQESDETDDPLLWLWWNGRKGPKSLELLTSKKAKNENKKS